MALIFLFLSRLIITPLCSQRFHYSYNNLEYSYVRVNIKISLNNVLTLSKIMYFFSMFGFPAWSRRGVGIRRNLPEPTLSIQIRDLGRQVVEEPLVESRSIWPRLSSCFSPRAKKKYSRPDTSYGQWTKGLASHARFPDRQCQYSTTNGTDDSMTTDNDAKLATHESIFHQTGSINPSADGKTSIYYSVSTVDKSAEPHGISTINENSNESAPQDLITFPPKAITATWPSDVQSPGGFTAFDRDVDNLLLSNGTRPIKEVERPALVPDLNHLEDVSLHAVHSAHPDHTKTSIGVKSLAALAASDTYRHVLSSLQWSTPCA